MKQLKIELGKFLAERIIALSLWVMPDCGFKELFTRFLTKHLMSL